MANWNCHSNLAIDKKKATDSSEKRPKTSIKKWFDQLNSLMMTNNRNKKFKMKKFIDNLHELVLH